MTPDEIAEWCELVFASFKETEIEHLEIFADWAFDLVERGVPIDVSGQLVLDRLKNYEKEDE